MEKTSFILNSTEGQIPNMKIDELDKTPQTAEFKEVAAECNGVTERRPFLESNKNAECRRGSSNLAEAECLAAAKKLTPAGKTVRLNSLTKGTYDTLPKGCSM